LKRDHGNWPKKRNKTIPLGHRRRKTEAKQEKDIEMGPGDQRESVEKKGDAKVSTQRGTEEGAD